MATKNADTTAEADASGGGKKKFIIIGLVLVVAAAAAAYFFFLKPSGEEGAKEEAHPGVVMALDPIPVNLAGGGYLKVGLSVQFTEDAEAAAGGHGSTGPDPAPAYDALIAQFSQANPADVNGGRENFRAALVEKLDEAYHGGIYKVYFTQYVTQ